MKPRALIVAAAIVAVAALPAAAFDLNINKLLDVVGKATQLREVGEAEEYEIGAGVSSNLLGASPLVNDPRVQKYVNAVGRWVALQTERPDLAWHFGVLDTYSVNAFATPGGYVFVTKGLVMRLNNEAELAGVLAHEIAHVVQKHHLKAIQKNAMTGIGVDVATMFADKRGRYTSQIDQVTSFGTELLARGLDRGDEFEADRMAVVIATRAGYNPYGLPAVLQMLEALKTADSNQTALLFKTHPAPRDRLDALELAMAPALDRYADQAVLDARFVQATGSLR